MQNQGHGAGEKKGVVENIKEKLPGGHGDHQQTGGTNGQQGHARVTGTGTHETGEKKDVMENIKEKLPGGHGDHQQTTGMTGTATHGTTATGGTYGKQGQTGTTGAGTHGTGEKKSVIENIQDKLPGQH
ncbi:unnamed protein product [Alopecurus aequalis]